MNLLLSFIAFILILGLIYNAYYLRKIFKILNDIRNDSQEPTPRKRAKYKSLLTGKEGYIDFNGFDLNK